MSMNLHCNQIKLRQTPTYVTYMCMVQPDGSIPGELNGNKAKHSLRIYIEWVKTVLQGRWDDKNDFNEAKNSLNEEINQIKNILNNNKKIEVYIL